jgi:hypothetical protein
MKTNSKKILTSLLALTLVFALAVTAFAAWPSFQNSQTNNGLIPASPAPHITTSPTVNSQTLQYRGSVFSGIDTTSVLDTDSGNPYAFTLYNGGSTLVKNGGARLSAVTVNNNTEKWNIQLDPADNVQQLSTPYLAATSNTLYAGVTSYTNQLASDGVAGWKDINGNPLDSYAEFNVGTTVIHYDNLTIPSDYWEPQLATNANSATGTISGRMVLTDGTNTYDLGSSMYYNSLPNPGDWTIYNANSTSVMVPAGTYTLTLTVDTSVPLYATSFEFLTSNWSLYKVTGIHGVQPAATRLDGGYGQINTPLKSTNGNVLYFGIYEGDRCYYQFTTTGTPSKIAFKPDGGEDFYYAGAYVNGVTYVVFGSESGKLYVRPADATFGSDVGQVIDLTLTRPDAGHIRSSVSRLAGQNYLYLTSQGSGANGYLWKISTNSTPLTLSANLQLPSNSTSTPVITSNNYIYVGYYNYGGFPSAGGVRAVRTDFSNDYSVYAGDPIQSSVVAYVSGTTDYVYFTTNSTDGRGCCYSFDTIAQTAASVWDTGEDGSYTLQGMASNEGYLVFGNDANKLFVVSP